MSRYFEVEEAHEGRAGSYRSADGQHVAIAPIRYRHAIYSDSGRLIFRTQTQYEAEELLGNLNQQQEEQ